MGEYLLLILFVLLTTLQECRSSTAEDLLAGPCQPVDRIHHRCHLETFFFKLNNGELEMQH
jgi:hypothetical protein